MSDGLNLSSGFAQGFANTMLAMQNKKRDDELFNLKKKALVANLELQERQKDAKTEFFAQQQGTALPGGFQGPPEETTKPRSLTEMLADPKGQILALQAGLTDIKGIQGAEKQQRILSFLENQAGGGGDVAGGSRFTIDPFAALSGNLQGIPPDLREITMEDGSKQLVHVNKEGKPFPIQQSAPSPADTPITNPSTIANLRDPQGNPPPMGITPRQALEQGFKVIKPEERTKISPEGAGRISGLVGAQQIGVDLRERILNKDGTLKASRGDLANMAFNTPFTEGRVMRQGFADAIDSVIRARTGAAATEEEMSALLEQFMPSPLDKDEGIVSKFDRLDKFLGGALDIVTLPESLRKRIEARIGTTGEGDQNIINIDDLP